MAKNVNDFTNVCPEDCDTDVVFTALPADPNCLNFDIYKSQIGDWIIRPDGAPDPFGTSWTGEDAVLAVVPDSIDNAAIDNTKCRRLRGIGGLGDFEDVVREAPYGEEIIVERVAPFNFRVQNASAQQRIFAKVMSCRPTGWTAYLGTEDHMIGKAGGMILRKIKVQMPFNEGTDEVQEIVYSGELAVKRVAPERSQNNPFE